MDERLEKTRLKEEQGRKGVCYLNGLSLNPGNRS